MSPYLLSPDFSEDNSGGDERDRTDAPLLAKQVLSQLSYTPTPVSRPFRIPFETFRTSKIKQRLLQVPLHTTFVVC